MGALHPGRAVGLQPSLQASAQADAEPLLCCTVCRSKDNAARLTELESRRHESGKPSLLVLCNSSVVASTVANVFAVFVGWPASAFGYVIGRSMLLISAHGKLCLERVAHGDERDTNLVFSSGGGVELDFSLLMQNI